MSKRRPVPETPPVQQPDETEYDSPLLLLTRMYWMFLGPSFALLSLIGVAGNSAGWLTVIDGVYFVLLGLLPLSRWLEFRLGKAETSAGKPATWTDFRNYLGIVAAGGLLAWTIAKLIANYLIAG